MTRDETIKILAILKAAYPNSYKNMTKDEANGTVMVWTTQFQNVSAELVLLAVNKLISTNTFPPAICEVKKKIEGMYWEVWETLQRNKTYAFLTDEQVQTHKRLLAEIEPLRNRMSSEPALLELIGGNGRYLLGK